MNRVKQFAVLSMALVAGAAGFSESPSGQPATNNDIAAEFVSKIAARLIADAIPRDYARTKDWGRTKQITAGLRSSGNFFEFDIHRKKTAVKHGIWKSYRVTLIEPEKNLEVRIDNLQRVGADRVTLTLFVTAKLHGWARAKIYERGIHIIALEAEGDTSVRLSLDAEIAVGPVPSKSLLPGIAIRPVITGARLKLDDFRLTRISDVKGSLARELGDGLRHLIEDELAGPKLVAKINRSIDKRRDRLVFTPDKLLGMSASKQPAPSQVVHP